jgi:putative ABC transport system permease protein
MNVMARGRFYGQYAVRNLLRERQRSAFALFCVAAGVVAIVGLQTLGLALGEALTSNARASNRGDVAAVLGGDEFFTAEQMAAFEQLVSHGPATSLTVRYRTQELPISLSQGQSAGQGLFLESFLVDPAVYPFYGQIRALDPPGASLAKLLADPGDVVIGKSLADRNRIAVGDRLLVGAGQAARVATVRGIVPSASAAPGSNLAPLLVGFVYLDYGSALQAFGLQHTASEVFFMVEDEAAAAALAAQVARIAPEAETRTAAELLAQNEQLTAVARPLTVVVGLMALLIGGLGIANTMLVVVARRRAEIALLKALGLKGRDVTGVFVTEAALLGLVGSLVGLPLGLGISHGLQSLAMEYIAALSTRHVYPLPLLTGLAAGVGVTMVFGLLPTLAAARIRPARLLRPGNGNLPRSGWGWSLGVVLALAAVMGLLMGLLLQSPLRGLLGAYGGLAILALLTGLLWVVVWIVERLPSWGWVSLRLAQRAIGRHRGRAASTLLALIVGLLSISLVAILGQSLIDTAIDLIAGTVGADLLIPAPADDAARSAILGALAETPGIVSYAEAASFPVELVAINGDPIAYQRRIATYEREQGAALTADQQRSLAGYFDAISARDLGSNLPDLEFAAGMGRNLTPADDGRAVILLPGSEALLPLQLQPGETLTFRLDNGAEVTLEIVGISLATEGHVTMGGTLIAPLGTLQALAEPASRLFLADVDPARKDTTVTALAARLPPQAAILETAAFVQMFSQLFRQFAVLPLLVAALTLFAAATMMANSMALATMERRREIGVMKAVGVRTNQVLGQLLLESAILGLVGGVLGVGLVAVAAVLLRALLSEAPARLNPWIILGLLALAVGLSLAATLIAAWPASRQRPLEVLRYE